MENYNFFKNNFILFNILFVINSYNNYGHILIDNNYNYYYYWEA